MIRYVVIGWDVQPAHQNITVADAESAMPHLNGLHDSEPKLVDWVVNCVGDEERNCKNRVQRGGLYDECCQGEILFGVRSGKVDHVRATEHE